jgi:hypothetical protein
MEKHFLGEVIHLKWISVISRELVSAVARRRYLWLKKKKVILERVSINKRDWRCMSKYWRC